MTLTLHPPPELEQRLTQEAKRQGLALDAYTLPLLDKSLSPKDRHTELVTPLQTWIDTGNPEEQQETGEYLIRALDEGHLIVAGHYRCVVAVTPKGAKSEAPQPNAGAHPVM